MRSEAASTTSEASWEGGGRARAPPVSCFHPCFEPYYCCCFDILIGDLSTEEASRRPNTIPEDDISELVARMQVGIPL